MAEAVTSDKASVGQSSLLLLSTYHCSPSSSTPRVSYRYQQPSIQSRCWIQLPPLKIPMKLPLKFLASFICINWIVKLTPLRVLFVWSQQINLPQIQEISF